MNELKRVTYNLPVWIVNELDDKAQVLKDSGAVSQKSASFELRKILEKALKKKTVKPPVVVEPAVGFIDCKNGKHPVTQSDMDSYSSSYPSVDILSELGKMSLWLDSNPSKKKTLSGAKRFINAWLSRAHEKPSGNIIDQSSNNDWHKGDLGL